MALKHTGIINLREAVVTFEESTACKSQAPGSRDFHPTGEPWLDMCPLPFLGTTER